MSDTEILEVKKKRDWNQFLKFPWKIYKDDPNWVPPLLIELKHLLNPSRNPFFQKGEANYWLAIQNGNIVGRIAAFVNRWHNEHYKDKVGFFGFFECKDDTYVASRLFIAAAQWLKENHCESMRGPINLSTSHECGLLIEGFDKAPVLQMTYNPPYYQELFESCVFDKVIDLLAFNIGTMDVASDDKVMQKLERIKNVISQKEKITFRKFNLKDYKNEIERVRILINDYMSDNWGFVPIEKEEFEFMATSLKQILIEDLAFFAEVDGESVGFSIALPDINQVLIKLNGKLFPFGFLKLLYYKNKINSLRVYLTGISKTHRKKGLDGIFYYYTIKECVKRKIKGAELSWVSEENTLMIQTLINMNAKVYKRYRIYEKGI